MVRSLQGVQTGWSEHSQDRGRGGKAFRHALGAETGKVVDMSNVVSLMVGAIVGFVAAAILAGGDDDERY